MVPKKKRGEPRMKEFGYVKVAVWLDRAQVQLIDAAAERAGMRRATFVRSAAVAQGHIGLKA